MRKVLRLIFIIALLSLSCSKDDGAKVIINTSSCNSFAEIIQEGEYNTIDTSNYSLTEVVLDENCLEITIGASGCDPESWAVELFSPDENISGNPAQRDVKVNLINNQACLAVFQKTVSFDLAPFQVDGQTEVILNIEGWDNDIVYNY